MLHKLNSDRIALRVDAVFRFCQVEDLAKLEWFGTFAAHRDIYLETFAKAQRGDGLMLICEVNDFPIGQIWARRTNDAKPLTARLWALRVMEPFQRLGIGVRLVRLAERVLIGRGFEACEIGVERSNPAARRLYTRLGYLPSYESVETYSYTTPLGEVRNEAADQWILSKALVAA